MDNKIRVDLEMINISVRTRKYCTPLHPNSPSDKHLMLCAFVFDSIRIYHFLKDSYTYAVTLFKRSKAHSNNHLLQEIDYVDSILVV